MACKGILLVSSQIMRPEKRCTNVAASRQPGANSANSPPNQAIVYPFQNES